MRLRNKPRGRSNSTCPVQTSEARARAHANILENSMSDPGNRKSRTFSSDEEEDFKFLENYMENTNTDSSNSHWDSESSTCSLSGSTERISSGEVVLMDKISVNVKKLGVLAEEIEFLNKDLTYIVEEEHVLLNADNIISEAYINRLEALNLLAKSDIQGACETYRDYMSTIKEIREAISSEEVRVLEKAYRLKVVSEITFQKVPPTAVERLRGVSTKQEQKNNVR